MQVAKTRPDRMALSRGLGGLALAAALALGGCVKLGSKVPDNLISLSPQAVAPAGAIGQGRYRLPVDAVNATGTSP